ncbi:MAG TPA: hypothetical protein VGE52_04855 [Pirellulales bacterium]
MLKSLWKSFAAALALGVFAAAPAYAQSKPIVVVSIAPLDKVFADAEYVAQLTGEGNDAGVAAAKSFTEGIDTTLPAGAVLSLSDDGTPVVIGFVPVKDLDTVLDTLKERAGQEAEDKGNGLKQVGPVLVKEVDGYAYIAQKEEHFEGLPAPKSVVGTLPAKYELAIQVNVQNVPVFIKQVAIQTMKQGIDQNLAKEDSESDAQFEMRREIARQQLQALQQFFDEASQMTFGLKIDSSAKTVGFEMMATAKDGTKMAKSLASLKDAQTMFGGLVVPTAPVAINFASQTDDQDEIAKALKQIEAYRETVMETIDDSEEIDSDEERELFKELAAEGLNIAESIVEGGKVDAALIFNREGAEDPMHILGALYVPEAKKLEALVKKVLNVAADAEPNFPKANFDVEEHAGVNLHSLPIPSVPDEDAQERITKVFGEKPEVFVGFSKDTAWFGVGTAVDKALKSAIDASGADGAKEIAPVQMSFGVSELMDLGYSLGEEAGEAPEAEELDRVRIVAESVDGGLLYRFEAEEGVLKLIGKAAKAAQAKNEEDVN